MAINYLSGFNFARHINNPKAVLPCPDQFIGNFVNGKLIISSHRIDIDYQTNSNNQSFKNSIVIVLESPHKNEFDPITLDPLGPAMGKIGEYFSKYFEFAFVKSTYYHQFSSGNYPIIIINAIQFQCSGGLSLSGKGNYQNKRNRDMVFITLLSNPHYNDLLLRIKAIKPKLVINLCTKGLMDLDQLVNAEIAKINNQTPTNGTHPSRWFDQNNCLIQ